LAEGVPSEEILYDNVQEVVSYLIQEKSIQSSQIFLWGRSLGTAPTLELASQSKYAGVILESPFLSILKVAGYFGLLGEMVFNMKDRFVNETKIKSLKSPLLILHGDCDTVVDLHHAEQLQKIAIECKIQVKLRKIVDGDHNNLHSEFYPDIVGFILEFISRTAENNKFPGQYWD